MKSWYHVDCFFEIKKTKNSKTINSAAEIEGWETLTVDDKKTLIDKLGADFDVHVPEFKEDKVKKTLESKDDRFSEFQRIVRKVANESSYKSKSMIIQKYFHEVRLESQNLYKMS